MQGYNFTAKKAFTAAGRAILACAKNGDELFIVCEPGEIKKLINIWNWNGETVYECTNLDETVRFSSYDGYDFISLIYVAAAGGGLIQQEINIFAAKRYLIFVTPNDACGGLNALRETLTASVGAAETHPSPLLYLYYLVLDCFATDFSNVLESLEDEIEELSHIIETKTDKEQNAYIAQIRKKTYTCKKLIRAASRIGRQILVDDNGLLNGRHIKYFRNIDARFEKLNGFAENLFDLSYGLVHLYDSKLSALTNETVNKLTVITIFFAPLTFIAGIYGMNFAYMPELNWKFGYPLSLLFMAGVSAAVVLILKKKKWF